MSGLTNNQRSTIYGLVGIAALDLRAAADHRSELESQLLLGEPVRRLRSARNGEWWQVECLTDGDRGWVRSWGLVPVTRSGLSAWERVASLRVRVLAATARSKPAGGAPVTPLYWRSRLAPAGRRGKWREVVLPSGRRAWVEATAVAGAEEPGPGLLERIDQLTGIPYLWGGRSPCGLDCSGFTQLVLGEQGWRLPRDADEQWRACRRVPIDRLRPGDLLFFAAGRGPVSHVGIWLGGGLYAHARGVVGTASLDPDNPLCDKQLKRQLRGAGRPIVRG